MSFISEVRNDIEREAFRLIREYHAMLVNEAKCLGADEQTAEDLAFKTIETYLAKPESELPPAEKLRSWLLGTIRNHYLHSVRGKARACTVYLDQSDVEKLQELGPVDNSTDEAILAHSDAEFVRKVLASLPEETRRVIVLHYFESLSIREIAALLARTPDSVKCNLYYARKVLAKRLGKALGRAALAIAALIFGGSLLYAAAVVTGFAPSPFAADEESEVVFNAKSTEDTEDSLTGLTGFTGLSEAGAPHPSSDRLRGSLRSGDIQTPNHETQGDSPQQFESITVNSNANNEENAMNIQSVKSAAVKALAAGAMLAATAAGADPVLGVSPTANTADSRAITITDMQYVDGAVVSVDISLEPIFCATGTLYAAFDDADMGDSLSAWSNVTVAAQTVTEADSSVHYAMPAGWGSDGYKTVRFFLVSSVLRVGDYARRLEYIDSSSTSDVDTGVVPTENSRVEGGVMRTIDAAQIAVHGVGSTGFSTWIGSQNNVPCRYFGKPSYPNMQAKDLWYYFVQSSANYYYEDGNGVTKTVTYGSGSATVTSTLHLFNNGTEATYRNQLRLVYWRHYTNDVLASSYIPVLRSDGVTADLWDVVSDRPANCPGLTAGPAVNFGTSFTNVTSTVSAVRAIPGSNYIQDGLVAQWDGIENGGAGIHWDIAANGWKDLVGGLVLTKIGGEPETDTTGVSLGSKTKLQVYDQGGRVTAVGRVIGGTVKTVEIVGRDCTSGAQNFFLLAMDGTDSSQTKNRLLMWYTDSSAHILGSVAMPQSNGISWFNDNDFGLAADENFSAAIVQPSAAQCLRYSNGQQCGSVAVANVVARSDRNSAAISLHGWYGKEGSTQTAYISAIRIYNRALTAQEIARNHALDAIRFRGESADGYRISNGRWQVRIRATSEDPLTVVAVGNVSGTEVETWVDLSSEVEISVRQFPAGKALRRWEDGSVVSYDERMKLTACYPVNAVAKLAVNTWTYANGELTNGDWTFAASGANDSIIVGLPSTEGANGTVDLTGEISVAGGGTGSIAGFVDETFKDNTALEVLAVPTSVRSIPPRFARNCVNLGRVVLHNEITNISHRAFRGLTKCSSFTPLLPPKLRSLGVYVFQASPLITTPPVFIPRTLTTCTEDEGDWRNSAYFDQAGFAEFQIEAGASLPKRLISGAVDSIREVKFLGNATWVTDSGDDSSFKFDSSCDKRVRMSMPQTTAWKAWMANAANVTPWAQCSSEDKQLYFSEFGAEAGVPYGLTTAAATCRGMWVVPQRPTGSVYYIR
ncbi:MAG: sigma-70 family RNA polymerase sigma factor [Kiritimatiellae bacterium]|nr:sigma-70 family RNA polymerase sigma factor [Kiritimatiellia bacterium]